MCLFDLLYSRDSWNPTQHPFHSPTSQKESQVIFYPPFFMCPFCSGEAETTKTQRAGICLAAVNSDSSILLLGEIWSPGEMEPIRDSPLSPFRSAGDWT